MKIENRASAKSIGFLGALTIAFIVLKLCNVINWSWLWVLSPIWIPIAIFIVGAIIFIGWALIAGKLEEKKKIKKS